MCVFLVTQSQTMMLLELLVVLFALSLAHHGVNAKHCAKHTAYPLNSNACCNDLSYYNGDGNSFAGS